MHETRNPKFPRTDCNLGEKGLCRIHSASCMYDRKFQRILIPSRKLLQKRVVEIRNQIVMFAIDL